MTRKPRSPRPLPVRLLNLLFMALDITGHAVVGVFLTNRWLMGLPELPYKAITLVFGLVTWPALGLAQLLLADEASDYAASLLRPTSRGWLARVFFVTVGLRWMVQEVYRRLNPAPPIPEVFSSHTREVDMTDYAIEAGGLPTTGLRGLINKVNHFYNLEITTHEVRVERLPKEFDGFALLQISDMHYGQRMSVPYLERLVEMCIDMQPDLIALTGDYQTYPRHVEGAATVFAPIGEWSCRERSGLGALAVLGNHDRAASAPYVIDSLRKAGVRVLNNEHVRLQRDGASLYVAGVADPWGYHADIDLALHGIPPDACVILLAHVPDYFVESSEKSIDLQLSGHNHGGQVILPVLGPIFVSSRYNRRYVQGFHKRNRALMYISRGIGGKPAIRWGAKPEVARLVLRSK